MSNQYNKNSVQNKAREFLRKGTSRQESYENLVEEFGHAETTSKIISGLPSKKAWKKYGFFNHILSVLMVSLFLTVILSAPSFGTLLWYGLPTMAVLMKKTRYYFWIVILVAFGSIGLIVMTLNSIESLTDEIILRLAIIVAVLIPTAFLAIWLPKKLTPGPEEVREFYENEYGERRSRIVYRFVD